MQRNSARQQMRGVIVGSILGVVALAALTALLYFFFACPCERLPGGYLLGEEISEPVDDWTFANEVPLCQIEVQRWLPHSINLNCMSAGGELFLSCSSCEGKTWSSVALQNSHARIRMHDRVFPVTLTRLTDPARLDHAWRTRARKLGGSIDTPRRDGWWSFVVVSR